MSRRSYSREFKLSAVKLVNHQGYTVTEATESLQLSIRRTSASWIKEVGPEGRQGAFRRALSRLREELRQLRQENISGC